MEVGNNATEFEHRSYGEELALCQRYYEQSDNSATQYRSGYHTGFIRNGYSFQVRKRVSPTVGVTDATNSAGGALALSISTNTEGFTYSQNSVATSYGVRFKYTASAEF